MAGKLNKCFAFVVVEKNFWKRWRTAGPGRVRSHKKLAFRTNIILENLIG